MKNNKWNPGLTASLFIVLLMCSLNCLAQGITKTDGTSTEPGQYFKDIRYGNQRSDISPNDRSSDRLLDIYLPNQEPPQNGFPVFIFIHGGGFSGGDKCGKSGLSPICKAMIDRGFAVVSINYYLRMKYHKISGLSCQSQMSNGLPSDKKFHPLIQKSIEDASADAVKVLKWLKKNADKYHLDSHSVALCGGSAGAITALHTVYVRQPKAIKIKAVINLWGAIENPEIITTPSPPVLTLHGDRDKLVSVKYGYAIQQRMEDIGNTNSMLYIMKNRGHAEYKHVALNYMNEISDFIKRQLKQW